jgi:acyl carrier protein
MMTLERDDIGREVLAIVKRVSRRSVEVFPQSALAADLGLDSLQSLEFVAELEDRFDIVVPLERVPLIQTVGQAVECVRSLVAAGARP